MRSGVIAQKVGMSRLFTEAGEHVPVTVLRLGNCQVVAHRTLGKDGYVALQLGAGARKIRNVSKAERGHFAIAKVEPKRKLAEFRVTENELIPVGAEITADHFVVGHGLGKDGVDCLGKALKAIDDSNQDVGDAPVLKLVHHPQPELGALGLLDPDAQNLLGAVRQDAESDIDRLIPDKALVADLDPNGIEEDQREAGIKRPVLPFRRLPPGRRR